ncbi:MAG: hypothetical protein JWQ90_2551 [Hydrocarboniphaga sp.]|nr:hypothetical protein [Hydrocarboniphaga sp.]
MSLRPDCLCNDCLAGFVGIVDSNGVIACPQCGGESCDCEGCQLTLHRLRAGERDRKALGLRYPGNEVTNWTEVEGCMPLRQGAES